MRLSVAVALFLVINGALLVPSTAREEGKRSLRGNPTPPVNELETATSNGRRTNADDSPSFHEPEEKARALKKEDKDNGKDKNKQAQKEEKKQQKQKEKENKERATNVKVEQPKQENAPVNKQQNTGAALPGGVVTGGGNRPSATTFKNPPLDTRCETSGQCADGCCHFGHYFSETTASGDARYVKTCYDISGLNPSAAKGCLP